MKNFNLCRPLSAIAKVMGILALAVVSSHAAAQIATTKHNLGTGGTAGNNQVTAGTDEICVFCHTPHGSNTTMTSAPLWNKATPPTTTYQVYDTTTSSTIDGVVLAPGAGGGSVSIACLSCHDGTQAMDNIINAPGSGLHDPTGGGATGRTYTWATGLRADTDGRLLNGGGFIAMLDTDLRNDHPIGIQYCGGGVNTTDQTTATCRDTDFNALTTDTINTQQVWWVDSGATAARRDKGDMILYSRDFGTGTGNGVGPSVECASCHDPHTANQTFLRIQNTGSAVCLACHNK